MLLKNKFIKLHRQLGLWMSFLMFVWFFSGIVMIYKTFPKFSKGEKKESYQLFNADSLQQYTSRIKDLSTNVLQLEIRKSADKFLFIGNYNGGETKRFFLDDGYQVRNINSNLALMFAETSFKLKGENSSVVKLNSLDRWIPFEEMYEHLPIYKFYFSDEIETEVYVSSKSGEILQHSTSSDRFWAYLGAIPHWFYIKELKQYSETWRWVMIFLSTVGAVMCLFGILSGVIRGFRRVKSKFRLSPYNKGLYRWHHYLGFVFGILTFTWTFSSIMSLTPEDISYSKNNEAQILQRIDNQKKVIDELNYDEILQIISELPEEIKKVSISKIGGENLVDIFTASNKSYRLSGNNLLERSDSKLHDNAEEFLKNLFQEKIVNVAVLTEHDNYYYGKSNKPPLPVIKLELNNDVNTHLYFDPVNLDLLEKTNDYTRLRRWLYKGLHSFDFIYSTPYWRPLILSLMIGGTLLSITVCLFIFRRMKKRFR